MVYIGHIPMESSILLKYNAIPRRVYKNEKTGKTSIWLEEVLERNVVVDRSITCVYRDPGPFRQTMFENVIVIPPMQVLWPETLEIFNTEKDLRTSDEELAEILIRLFEKVVEAEWEPNKFHFVLHSSGFDSRILSETIKRLWLKNGDSWLGDILFVCNKFEANEFKAIMQYQGWNKDQYMAVRDNVPDSDYHAQSLDFKNCWKKVNCIFGMPVNLFYYPLEWAQMIGRAPEDEMVQSWCNYLTPIDYTLKLDLFEKYRFLYFHAMGGRNFKGENMQFPGAHPDLLSRAVRYSTDLGLNQVKRLIVREMDKELYELPETKTDLQGDWGRELNNVLFSKTVNDYNNSWYGRRVQQTPIRVISFSPWWARWTVASFCQHLLRSGYNLVMK